MADKSIREIAAPEVLGVLRRIEARGTYETARRLRSLISRVFRYAVATGRAETDPTFALQGALIRPKLTSRAALTDKQGLTRLVNAIEAYEGQATTRAALKLLLMLVPRPGELRHARWAEFDLDKAVWSISAERTTMRRTHRVPLPGAAIGILKDLHPITGGGELVLPSLRSARRPISENTLKVALRSMGFGKDEVTSHGFRASFSTLANESGLWNPDAIERALAHVEPNSVRRAYARGEHWEERVRLMQWWADQLGFKKEGGSSPSDHLPIQLFS